MSKGKKFRRNSVAVELRSLTLHSSRDTEGEYVLLAEAEPNLLFQRPAKPGYQISSGEGYWHIYVDSEGKLMARYTTEAVQYN